ncbi:hypothetical protein R3P38DRAFT_3190333 [Favolaschia claudopus]|uniref:Uncharacterized protein n=1 Tax=Favolaschia claudopus TaxID=2862362 RepID=A0AAW0BPN7_9AGAR
MSPPAREGRVFGMDDEGEASEHSSPPLNYTIPTHRVLVPAEPHLSCPVAFSTRLPHSPPPQVLAPQAADRHKEHRQQQRQLASLISVTVDERGKKTNDTLEGGDDGKETETREYRPRRRRQGRGKVHYRHAPVLPVLKEKRDPSLLLSLFDVRIYGIWRLTPPSRAREGRPASRADARTIVMIHLPVFQALLLSLLIRHPRLACPRTILVPTNAESCWWVSAWDNEKSIDADDATGGKSTSAGAGAAGGEEIFAYSRALAFPIHGGQAWTDAAAKGEVGKDHRHRKTGLPLLTKDSSMGVEDNGKNTHVRTAVICPAPTSHCEERRRLLSAYDPARWRNVDRAQGRDGVSGCDHGGGAVQEVETGMFLEGKAEG